MSSVESVGEVLTVHTAPRAFHLIAKLTGAICNRDGMYAAEDAARGRNEPA